MPTSDFSIQFKGKLLNLHLQVTPLTSIEITSNLLRKHSMAFLGHLKIME